MTPRKPRYTGRFRHVNSLPTINILVLYMHPKLIANTDFSDGTDFLGGTSIREIRDFATPHSAPLGQRIRGLVDVC